MPDGKFADGFVPPTDDESETSEVDGSAMAEDEADDEGASGGINCMEE